MKLSVSNVSVQLPGMTKPLFAIRNLQVGSGERILIQGPSGKGKTTLLHLMAGLMAPNRGSVSVDENDLSRMSELGRCRFRRQNVGIIFQKLNLISHLTAQENVELALLGKPSDPEQVALSLKRVRVEESAPVLAQYLSIGQQQRVAVARILAQRPRLVFADEPTSSLDDVNAEAVISALFDLSRETTIVVVSHDQRIRPRFSRVIDFSELVDK